MGRCIAGVSQGVLLVSNTLLFLIAAGSLGLCIYLFHDEVASSLTKVSILTIAAIISVPMMLFAFLGCKTAYNPPEKRCSRCLYLTILMILFLAEFIIGGLVYNVSNALQVAKDHNFDIQGDANKAARTVLHFLHDQLDEVYDKGHCQGGSANSSQIPIEFEKISCNSASRSDAINTIFKHDVIRDTSKFYSYTNCTSDSAYTPSGEKPSDFTQAFCGSQANVASLAQKYSSYLMWFPIGLGILTLVLLIATVCIIGHKHRQRVQMQGGRDGLNGVNGGQYQISAHRR
jgi:ABC-type multidrug transport system fused ATPase/permease subunit